MPKKKSKRPPADRSTQRLSTGSLPFGGEALRAIEPKVERRTTVIPHLSKSPQQSHTVDTGKIPKAYAEDWAKHHPSWWISRLDTEGPFGWDAVEQKTLCDIRAKLKHFEGMTLGEIFVKAKKQNHSVDVSKLNPMAQARLKKISQDDIDALHALHLSEQSESGQYWNAIS